jgi:hypothetical protein
MKQPDCEICNDKGFVRDAHDNVKPCPVCGEDAEFYDDVWDLQISEPKTTPFEEDDGAGDS